jgi:hypothetical protein
MVCRDPLSCLKKGVMAAIDYATCGINDIIAHSLNSHPRLLADCLRLHARVHAEFADAYNDGEVMRNELDLAGRLHALAHAIEVGDHTLPDDSDVRRGAFSCAARLQDLHPFMQSLITEREQAQPGHPGAKRLSSLATTSRNQRWPGS